MSLILCGPGDAASLVKESGRWAYVDGCVDVLLQLGAQLGGGRLWVRPHEFQERARARLDEYVQWCDRQIARRADPSEWILSPFGRNPFESDQFVHIVWLDLVARHYAAHEPLCLITEDAGFAEALTRLAGEKGWRLAVHGKAARQLAAWRRMARRTLAMLRETTRWLARVAAARLMLGRIDEAQLARVRVLLVQYFEPGTVSPDGVVRDRYFPGLAEWYRDKGISCAFYPLLDRLRITNLAGFYRSLRRSKVPVYVAEQFVGLADVLRAAWRSARRARSATAAERIFGIDPAPMLRRQGYLAALGAMPALVLERAPRRIVQSGFKGELVLEWYENQGIGRASALGWKNSGARVRHVAMRQYVPATLFASFYATPEQLRAGACPAEEWVCGKALPALFQRHAPSLVVRVVPAIRYRQLYDALPAGAQADGLLVVLSHSEEDNKSILSCVIEALASGWKPAQLPRIKSHPDQDLPGLTDWLAHAAPAQCGTWIWEPGSLSECFSRAGIVITSGTGAAVEALCRALPVIVVERPAGLDLTPLDLVPKELWRSVSSGAELRDVVQAWTPAHPLGAAARAQLAQDILQRHFEPVTEAAMGSFAP